MAIYDGFVPANYDLQFFALPTERCEGGRERPDRRRGRKQGGERVAAVDKIKEKRKPEDFVGHRNSKTDISIRRGFSAEKRVQQGEPKNSRSSEREFFYPSRQAWYIITTQSCISSTRRCRVVSHHTFRCALKICRLDDIQLLTKLMICNSCGIDDI